MPESTPAPQKRTRNRTAAGNTRTITLRSSGSLTLSGTFNFLELSAEDREFIFQLADTMTKYQNSKGATVGQSSPAAGGSGLSGAKPPVN